MTFQFGALVADDSRFKQALERRAEILRGIQSLQTELQVVDEFVSLYEKLFHRESGARASEPSAVPGPKSRRQRNLLPPARLAEICREIIIETGRPMTRSELLHELQERGIPMVGGDPSKVLGTILWRAGKFDNIKGQGYWPSDMPRDAGGVFD